MELFGGGGLGAVELSRRSATAWNSYFFAVLPPPDIAEAIDALGQRLRRSMGMRGKLLGPERYHISLSGIGAFGAACPQVIDRLTRIGAVIHAPIFNVVLDQTAAFGGSGGKRALVLASSDTLPALVALQARLHEALQMTRLPDPTRFNPHLTLLYDRRPARQIGIPPVSFPVREFVLIRSVQGESRHHHLARWPLGGGWRPASA
jgi:RNA 2',3'-cyclic 3'-phosphodiesterase